MHDAAFAQTLINTTDFETGLHIIARRVHEVIPFERMSVFVFPKDGSPPRCHVVTRLEPFVVKTVEVPQPDLLMKWLGEHPEPFLVPSHNPVFVPTALKNYIPIEFPYHVLSPTVVANDVVGLWLLGLKNSEHWKAPRIDALKTMRAVRGLWLDNILMRDQIALMHSQAARDVVYLREEIKAERGLRSLSGDSAAMKVVRRAIQQVAATDSTVLIHGETGTGKELVARAIHQVSARRERLLVGVNCAALAPSIIASELFGHEAGAFTGASKRRIGRFELAHQGTLFLDEIAEISTDLQVMLLRVLQEKTIERVGGNVPIPVDVRLIAATHEDLAHAVGERRFRPDLYYRLNVFPIRVPPLRERCEDIPDLVRHFLLHFNRRMNKQVDRLAPQALDRLMHYDWPGNVRELENLIERAMIVADGSVLDIDANWLTSSSPGPLGDGPRVKATSSLRDQEKQTILDAIARCNGKIYGAHGAAAHLGLKPTTLYGKMRKLGISKPGNEK